MNTNEIKEKLNSKKSKDRLRAAKEIGKQNLNELSEDLLAAYKSEIRDSRTWAAQVAMLHSLGIINNVEVLPLVDPIVRENKAHDAITGMAAETYVRIKRDSIHDAKPVIELLGFGEYSLINGCLNPLGYDKMIPSDEEINTLIKLSWDLHKKKTRGFMDPRYGIAAACAGWRSELTSEFLNHCLDTAAGDTPLEHVAKNSLESKYVRLR